MTTVRALNSDECANEPASADRTRHHEQRDQDAETAVAARRSTFTRLA